jgi:DNA-directed RNA polymerase II subunit RPB11
MNAPHRFLTWRHEEEFDENIDNAAEALSHLTTNPVAIPFTPKHDVIPPKLAYVVDSKRTNTGTFILSKEDHTIGNLMRIQLLRNNKVRFAGYRMPHPLIFDCHIRVETTSETTPAGAFNAALSELEVELEHLKFQFDDAVKSFQDNNLF